MENGLSFLAKKLVFMSGKIINQGQIIFIAQLQEALEKEIESAQILIWEKNNNWRNGGQYRWSGIDITQSIDTDKQFIGLGRDGQIASGDIFYNFAEESPVDPNRSPGPMRGIRRIGDTIFAYGMQRHVYRRIGKDMWTLSDNGFPKLDKSLLKDKKTRLKAIMQGMGSINALAGKNENHIYGVGIRGEIWFFDGTSWSPVDSPTNLILNDVLIAPDNSVYVCGQGGTIIKGDKGSWQLIEYEGAGKLDFCSMAWFQNKLYLADGQSLQILDNGTISLVDFGLDDVVPCHHVHSNDDMLLSLAGKEIYTTVDGSTWTPLI